LTALALVHLVALPNSRVQGPLIAAISVAAIAAASALAWALTCAGAAAGRAAWRVVAALGALTIAGWLATRAVEVPGVAEDAGRWTSRPGLACAALAAALVGLAAAGAGTSWDRGTLRTLAAATGVGVALAPAVAVMVVALGPAPAHHHGLAPATVTAHARHALHRATAASGSASPAAAAARFRPGFGGHAGHYVYANTARPHLPPWALALALGAAATLVSVAGGALRGRAGPMHSGRVQVPRRMLA
jgi:hypothetical protein